MHSYKFDNCTEHGSEVDISKDSTTSVAALDLVSGGEGGRKGALPCFFRVSKAEEFSNSSWVECSISSCEGVCLVGV